MVVVVVVVISFHQSSLGAVSDRRSSVSSRLERSVIAIVVAHRRAVNDPHNLACLR